MELGGDSGFGGMGGGDLGGSTGGFSGGKVDLSHLDQPGSAPQDRTSFSPLQGVLGATPDSLLSGWGPMLEGLAGVVGMAPLPGAALVGLIGQSLAMKAQGYSDEEINNFVGQRLTSQVSGMPTGMLGLAGRGLQSAALALGATGGPQPGFAAANVAGGGNPFGGGPHMASAGQLPTFPMPPLAQGNPFTMPSHG